MRQRAPLFALLGSLLVGVGWWFLLYEPKLEEQDEIEAETVQLEAEESQLRSRIAELERIRDDEMAIRAELALMEEYIPDGVTQPTALRELQDAADSAGVEIETIAFGDPVAMEEAPETGEPGTTLAQVGVSMSAEGGYFQVVDLLRRFEVDVPRGLVIDSVAIGEGGDDGFPVLTSSWDGRMFTVVDVASTVAPEDGEPEDGDAEDSDAEDGDGEEGGGEDADDLDADDEGVTS